MPGSLVASAAVATDKRARQKANRAAAREAAAAAEKKAETRQRITFFAGLAAVVLIGAFLISVLGGDDEESSAAVETETAATETEEATTTTVAETTTTVAADAPPVLAPPAAGGTITGETPCPAEDGEAERITQFESAPPMCIDPAKAYTATITTDAGEFTIELDAAGAPMTVNNFVVLARYGYYEGVPFHRIIPGFVVQGGDAIGDGSGGGLGRGGPGYRFGDELPEAGEYELGSVAMANSGADTNGSQFFIVTGPNGAALPPQYSLFGTVTAGFDDVVKGIEAVGTSGGEPTEVVTIESVTITES